MKPALRADLIQGRPINSLVDTYRNRAGRYRKVEREGLGGLQLLRAVNDMLAVGQALVVYHDAAPLALALKVESDVVYTLEFEEVDDVRRAKLSTLLRSVRGQVRRFLAVDWANLSGQRREELMTLVRTMRELAD